MVVSRFLYGLEAIGPVAELNADNTVRSRFVYATRSYVPDYMIRDGVTYRYVTDELGSVRRVVNTGSGTVEQAIDYDPYGVTIADTQPGFQPFGYTGGLTDPDTGLVQLGARDYDPVAGRWISKDPIGFDGGDSNLYAYVAGDPINNLDPTGLLWDSIKDDWDASTEAAQSATAYWADQSVNSDSSIVRAFAAGAGTLSALWACSNADDTLLTLVPAGRLGGLLGRLGRGAGTTRAASAAPAPAYSPLIPKGAQGPFPTRGAGYQYIGGAGGSGLHANVTGVRFMEATAHHPVRRVYMNASGQTVHPFTGRTIPPNHPMAHIPEP